MSHLIMGVVNINPDSLYSKRCLHYNDLAQNIDDFKGRAHILDIGAESTSPYSSPITFREEISRLETVLLPLLEVGWPSGVALSLDTYHVETITFFLEWLERKKLLPLIDIIWNDISGAPDLSEAPLGLLEKYSKLKYILCHNFASSRDSSPQHMQFARKEMSGKELLAQMISFFERAENTIKERGIDSDKRVFFDPAFAFSKTREQNIFLLDNISCLLEKFSLEKKWVIGISRKSFLRRLSDLKSQDPSVIIEIDERQKSILSHLYLTLPFHQLIFRVHSINVTP